MQNHENDESVSHYKAGLRRLTQYFEQGDSLEQMSKDGLVCGVYHERTQQMLQSKILDLTLQKALDILFSSDSAIKQSVIMQGELQNTIESVVKIDNNVRAVTQNTKCFRCEGNHSALQRPFLDKECYFSENKGQISKV